MSEPRCAEWADHTRERASFEPACGSATRDDADDRIDALAQAGVTHLLPGHLTPPG